MKKECSKCGLEKSQLEFFKDNRTKDGLYSHCKQCHRFYRKQWNIGHKDKIRTYHLKFLQENKGYWSKYERERKKTDIKFRLDKNMKNAISNVLKGKKEWRKWKDLVGYNVGDLMKHLEGKFEDWMNWENYGKWEIDHIKPKSLFKYETAEDTEFKKCWALENLQPLERIANIKKYNHYDFSHIG